LTMGAAEGPSRTPAPSGLRNRISKPRVSQRVLANDN
jgi:hypothetical protein